MGPHGASLGIFAIMMAILCNHSYSGYHRKDRESRAHYTTQISGCAISNPHENFQGWHAPAKITKYKVTH